MTLYKKYTNEQYVKFLQHPFASNFGKSKEDTINWFVANCAASIKRDYNVTYNTVKNTYLPTVEYMLGGYFMFFAICVNEGGGAGNWINHFGRDTSSTPLGCLKDDCEYILKQCNNQQSYVCLSAVEVMGGAHATEDNPGAIMQAYKTMKTGSLGRYYMTATLAGNSWVWCTQWSLRNQGPRPPAVYYNNPYDVIIDLIKKAGADPFGDVAPANPNPIAGNPKPPKDPDAKKEYKAKTITPGLIYLNNSNPVKLNDNIKFTRFKNFISLQYEYESTNTKNETKDVENNTKVDQQHDNTPANDKVKKMLNRLKMIYLKQYYYSNVRPAPNLATENYTDCSGFVGWVMQDVYPTIWNRGYLHTGTIFAGMKSAGCQVFYTAGGRSAMRAWSSNLKTGDIVLMSNVPDLGAGLNSHVGIMYGDGAGAPFVNQNGTDTNWTKSFSQTLAGYDSVNLNQPYWAVVRAK
ncbi:MAG: hypothetical protein J6574_03935 [Gilliamella sp.]|nr:hypothetical protein [Gilliamella sp.]